MAKSSEGVAETPAKNNELRETVVIIIQALLIALVFRTFLFQPFSIPTASMQSTLLIGDYVLASKYTWGYGTYSLPLGIIPIPGRIFGREPNRGDIAVFRPVPQEVPYIKRVIGLPGDAIQMIDGILNINGVAVKREYVGDAIDRVGSGREYPVKVYNETLPNGVVHLIQEISDNGGLDNTDVYHVPPGHYFMMGDNRDNSSDSRVLNSVGYVPAGNLIGKGEVRFFSIKDDIPPWQFWRWPGNIRFDRMFQSLY